MSGAFTFHSGDYSPVASYLFNDRKHVLLQSPNGWECFYVLDGKQYCVAFVWLHIEKEIASSPFKAPFASIEFNEELSPKVVYDFLDFVERELKILGVKKVIIKMLPDVYEPTKNSLLNVFLYNKDYAVSHAEVSTMLNVSNADYESHVTKWELRKLKQAKAEGFAFHQHEVHELSLFYTFIEQCRAQKGYTLSMSLNEITALQNTFTENVLLFSITKQQQLVAACIALRVSKNVLYTFYYDHASAFSDYSPVVILIEGIYIFCQQQQIALLDLGSASLNGQPNFNLLDFKLHLGGRPSAKLTFQKEL